MSTDAKVAIAIFAVAMVGTIGLGIAAMRGRDADLDEWSVGGRSFGVILTWVLLAGECYTSFSYLGAAGWAYGYGAPILYLVGYMATGYATVYLFAPMVWGYAKRHNLISSPTSSPTASSRRASARSSRSSPRSRCCPTSSCRSRAWAWSSPRSPTARSASRPRS